MADWVAGLSTAGTLAVGLGLIATERRDRLRDQAEGLRATLDVLDPADLGAMQPLVMEISNAGDNNFWNVTTYRKCRLQASGAERIEHLRVVASVPHLPRRTKLHWVVKSDCFLDTGRTGHELSFVTLTFCGKEFARWPGELPKSLTPRVQGRVHRNMQRFDRDQIPLIRVDADEATYERIA